MCIRDRDKAGRPKGRSNAFERHTLSVQGPVAINEVAHFEAGAFLSSTGVSGTGAAAGGATAGFGGGRYSGPLRPQAANVNARTSNRSCLLYTSPSPRD